MGVSGQQQNANIVSGMAVFLMGHIMRNQIFLDPLEIKWFTALLNYYHNFQNFLPVLSKLSKLVMNYWHKADEHLKHNFPHSNVT